MSAELKEGWGRAAWEGTTGGGNTRVLAGGGAVVGGGGAGGGADVLEQPAARTPSKAASTAGVATCGTKTFRLNFIGFLLFISCCLGTSSAPSHDARGTFICRRRVIRDSRLSRKDFFTRWPAGGVP